MISVKQPKRRFRNLSDATKQKISNGLKGRVMDAETKRKISQSMLKYWQTVPYSPFDSDGENKSEKGKEGGLSYENQKV